MSHKHSIELLNQAVSDELLAVHQYMYFHFHLADQGLRPLASLFKRTAIAEMGHVEALSERILFLKGDVEMAVRGAVGRISDSAAMLQQAMEMEAASARDYNNAALECGKNADAGSKQVFEQLIADEEGHFAEFEKQLENIKRYGPSYLALQSFASASDAGEPASE
jgi:bacterioferritin